MADRTRLDMEVRVAALQPGDILVVKVDEVLTNTAAEMIRNHAVYALSQAGHPDTPVLILQRGMSLAILRDAA